MFGAVFEFFRSIFLFVGMVSHKNSFPPTLSADEERALVNRHIDGDRQARDLLIEHNLRLVAHIAKKYATPTRSIDDLISIGTIGLIKAVETLDPDKCRSVAGYASRCIENEILMYIRSDKKHAREVSLEESVGIDRDGNEITLSDILPSEDGSVLDKAIVNSNSRLIRETISKKLTERERRVVILRYGLIDGRCYPQREVGKMLGISRSYVSRIEKKALDKLNSCMTGRI
ncbi:MAG: RNA polymerase sporulation sigma factor SigK [Clostridia bacterium]|nr:RNA polymerase sporulation sigma factor SigK [Clostridia bacterium]